LGINNLILQYGIAIPVTNKTVTTSIGFPISFLQRSIPICVPKGTTTRSYSHRISNVTLSGFDASAYYGTNDGVSGSVSNLEGWYWIAIGY